MWVNRLILDVQIKWDIWKYILYFYYNDCNEE